MTTDNDATRPVPADLRYSQERTIGQLVAQVVDDLRTIVRTESQLAKTEITAQLGIAGNGAGMLATAGVLALYGLGLLFIALSLVIAIRLPAWAGVAGVLSLYGLALLFIALSLVIAIWLPAWAGFLIMAVVLFLVTAILALLRRRADQKRTRLH